MGNFCGQGVLCAASRTARFFSPCISTTMWRASSSAEIFMLMRRYSAVDVEASGRGHHRRPNEMVIFFINRSGAEVSTVRHFLVCVHTAWEISIAKAQIWWMLMQCFILCAT